jgi:hypothetical protein
MRAEAILAECRTDEQCVAIVPSARVLAGEFALILKDNDVIVRPLGHGSGSVIDEEGKRATVSGILVVAVQDEDLRKLSILARMCGIAFSPVKGQE